MSSEETDVPAHDQPAEQAEVSCACHHLPTDHTNDEAKLEIFRAWLADVAEKKSRGLVVREVFAGSAEAVVEQA